MKKERLFALLENCIMVLLFAAMLFQCAVYVGFVQSENAGLSEFPESEKKRISNIHTSTSETANSFIIPYFVGAITENGNFAGAYSENSAYEIFGYFLNVLENAVGGTCKKVAYSDSEKKYEYLDNLYINTKNCYYVCFENGIEFSALCGLITDTYDDIPENPDFIVKDMFLLCGSLGETSITAVDPDGNVLKIFPSKNISFNNEYLETYNGTDKYEFEFVKADGNTKSGKNCYFPSYKYSIGYETVKKKNFNDKFSVSVDSVDIQEFISIFGMNTDNTHFYKKSDGSIVCVEANNSFEISVDGNFTFTSEKGKNLSVFAGVGINSEYGFYDYTSVAKSIVKSINEKLVGCRAKLTLNDIIYNNGECLFRCNYTVDGIPIENSEIYGLELKFSGENLISASGKIEVIEYSNKAITDMPQRTLYVLLPDSSDFYIVYFGAEYCFDSNAENSDIAVLRWTAKTESVEKEAIS